MKNSNKFFAFALYMILGTLFTFSLCAEIVSCTSLIISSQTIFLFCVSSVFALFLVFYNRYTALVFLCFVFVLTVIVALDFWSTNGQSAYLSELTDYLTRLGFYVRGYTGYDDDFRLAIVALLSISFSFLFSFLYRLFFSAVSLITIGVTVFVCDILLKYHNNDTFILMFLVFSIVVIAQSLNKRGARLRLDYRQNAAFTLSVIPLCLAVVFLSSQIPTPKNLVNSQAFRDFADSPIKSIENALYLAFNPKHFSFKSTGFSGGDSQLGGNAVVDNSTVFYVETSKRTYLAGEIKGEYTGREWLSEDFIFDEYYIDPADINSSVTIASRLKAYITQYSDFEVYSNNIPIDAAELYFNFGIASLALMNGAFNAYVRILPETMEVPEIETMTVFVKKRTASLFFPIGYINLQSSRSDIMLNSYSFRSEGLLTPSEKYSFDFISIDTSDPSNAEFLHSSKRGVYQERISQYKELEQVLNAQISYSSHGGVIGFTNPITGKPEKKLPLYETLEYFASRADMIYSKYTQLPEELPDRVKNLAEELTADCETDYSKVEAIKNFLSGYTYTLTPGDTPQGKDFADYFLFEQRQGYCTHFATAFTLLCRSIGMPVRYIEGFVIPDKLNSSGGYTVTNAHAHAWPEVYFEGAGWLRIEPTSGYSDLSDTVSVFNDNNPSSSPKPEDTEEYIYDDDINLPRSPAPGKDITSIQSNPPVDPDDTDNTQLGYDIAKKSVSYVLKAAQFSGIILALYVFAMHIVRLIKLGSLRKKAANTVVYGYFDRIMNMHSKSHAPIKDGQTILAYASGSKTDYMTAESKDFYIAAKIYSYTCYSGKNASNEDLTNIRTIYKTMTKKFIKKIGRLKYHFLVCTDKKLR